MVLKAHTDLMFTELSEHEVDVDFEFPKGFGRKINEFKNIGE